MVWDSSFNCDLDQEQRMGVCVRSPHRAAAQSAMENSYRCAISSLGWNRCRFVCTLLHLDAADGLRWNRRQTTDGSAHVGFFFSINRPPPRSPLFPAMALFG